MSDRVGRRLAALLAATILCGNAAAAADYELKPQERVALAHESFQGAYVALGGSYGVSQPLSTAADPAPAKGWSGNGALGFNMQGGRLVAGLEVSGRFGNEAVSASAGTTQQILGGVGIGPGGGIVALPPNIIATQNSSTWKTDAGAHLSGRIGMTAGADTLLFLQTGLGLSHVAITSTSITTFNGALTSTFSSSLSRWYPSVVVGLGVEQNFGRAFVQLKAEEEAIVTTGQVALIAHAVGSVGFRF